MFIKSSLRGQKVHKSMNFVHDLATLFDEANRLDASLMTNLHLASNFQNLHPVCGITGRVNGYHELGSSSVLIIVCCNNNNNVLFSLEKPLILRN